MWVQEISYVCICVFVLVCQDVVFIIRSVDIRDTYENIDIYSCDVVGHKGLNRQVWHAI